jgi:hypothetical protein
MAIILDWKLRRILRPEEGPVCGSFTSCPVRTLEKIAEKAGVEGWRISVTVMTVRGYVERVYSEVTVRIRTYWRVLAVGCCCLCAL